MFPTTNRVWVAYWIMAKCADRYVSENYRIMALNTLKCSDIATSISAYRATLGVDLSFDSWLSDSFLCDLKSRDD